MELTDSILTDIREAIGLSSEPSPFDKDLLMHINAALGKLLQAGIGLPIIVKAETTWAEFQNPTQTYGNQFFQMVPLFVTLNTKLIFDPPPPSSVEYHKESIEQLLWRLKFAYEEPYVASTTTEE
jgi:hypothetical protein